MSRRHAAEKRKILPDAKFGDLILSKFMNNLMDLLHFESTLGGILRIHKQKWCSLDIAIVR